MLKPVSSQNYPAVQLRVILADAENQIPATSGYTGFLALYAPTHAYQDDDSHQGP